MQNMMKYLGFRSLEGLSGDTMISCPIARGYLHCNTKDRIHTEGFVDVGTARGSVRRSLRMALRNVNGEKFTVLIALGCEVRILTATRNIAQFHEAAGIKAASSGGFEVSCGDPLVFLGLSLDPL